MKWILLFLVWANMAAADPVTDRLEAAFDNWMAEQGIKMGSLAILKDGAVANTPDPIAVELASLSKAITAVCVMHLVDEGLLGYDTKVAPLIGQGPKSLTVAQLLTHSGGLSPDLSQGFWSISRFGGSASAHRELTNDTLARTPNPDLVGSYFYSNTNYAVLATVIEIATDQTYHKACLPRVFGSVGVVANPSVQMRPFLAWGGWTMTPKAYALFHRHYFGPDSAIGRDPKAYPHVSMGGGAFYGMGMVFRDFRDTHNFWHFGAHCFPFKLNVGSYVVQWEETWSVVAAYEGCLDWDQMFALDGALSQAVYHR